MNLINLTFLLLLSAIAMLYCFRNANRQVISATTIAAVLAVTLLGYTPSAIALNVKPFAALGASDLNLTAEQSQLEEGLKMTPGGTQYSGVEYASATAPEDLTTSDSTIKENIELYSDDRLVVYVINGAVRLSGVVQDKESADRIIELTKAMPAVHEITFDFNLES
ncbi:MAG: BON domain-containing protein [Prochloraceae cyanobacterium]